MLTILKILCMLLCIPCVAYAALPANELWREALLNDRVGYGRNATGGAGGTLCQVTNLNESGAGSLRACAEATGTLWITFTVSGTINLSSRMFIRSNKTIDGRGADITISHYGLYMGIWQNQGVATDNVIIENIKIIGIDVDSNALQCGESCSNIWVDHVTFQNAVDEEVYLASDGSDGQSRPAPVNVTLSWINFMASNPYNPPTETWQNKSLLVSDPSLPQDAALSVTVHHSHYQTYVRHPLGRYATFHAFNNYYHNVVIGVDCVSDLRFLSENEIFDPGPGSDTILVKVWLGGIPASGDGECGTSKVTGALLQGGASYQEVRASSSFNPAADYSYTLDTANTALQNAIIAGAGWQNVTPPVGTPETRVILRLIR